MTVPLGVMVALPPDVPASPLAATVPCRNFPFRAATSVVHEGQAALTESRIKPEILGDDGFAELALTDTDCPIALAISTRLHA